MIGDTDTAREPSDVIGEIEASSSSSDADVPAFTAQSLEAIEAEGNEARWQTAKDMARAVFQAPALVTSRRLALLGDEGLAAFVDETRAITKAYILRERSRQGVDSPSASISTERHESRNANTAPKQNTHRRPAHFRVKRPRQRSAGEWLMSWIGRDETFATFVSDLLFGSLGATTAIGVSLLLHRFAFLLFQ